MVLKIANPGAILLHEQALKWYYPVLGTRQISPDPSVWDHEDALLN
jgi:hypothetical protein